MKKKKKKKKEEEEEEVGRVIQREPMSFNKASWSNFGVYITHGCEIATSEIMTHKCSEQAPKHIAM